MGGTPGSDAASGHSRYGPPHASSAACRRLSIFQWAFLGVVGGVIGALVLLRPGLIPSLIIAAAAASFLAMSIWRMALVALSATPPDGTVLSGRPLPPYSVLVALYDEAEVMDQLVSRLARIDYPSDRLQGLLVLEARDTATIAAAEKAARPDWLQVYIAPPGQPGTKPRALNCALSQVTGTFLTVYDAEDEPHPLQLREAAARFVGDGAGRLACLQAPLRIRPGGAEPGGSRFLGRQFAAEYASLFETTLPGLTRLGLPFPLGGTSNHFRAEALRQVGGWDGFNVTEDADLGFRLWAHGWRLGMLAHPTWETPPGHMVDWLPQRTRWLKGYMQTFGVHSRRPWRLGARGSLALSATVGAGIVSAVIHGPSAAWIIAAVLVAATAGLAPGTPLLAVAVLLFGAFSAWLSCAVGARRAGIPYGLADMLAAPAYWSLQSLAAAHAAWRLVREPFAWDKTRHRRDGPFEPGPVHAALYETAPDRLSAGHAAAPQPVA